jgi:hypothetical protein
VLSEVFKTIREIRPFFLLVIFITLSIIVSIDGPNLLDNPVSPWSLVIPFITLMSLVLSWGWIEFIAWLSCLLPKDDLVDFGYIMAISLMSFFLLITFSYFTNHYETLSISIVGSPSFIYMCTLYLAALVAFDVAGN